MTRWLLARFFRQIISENERIKFISYFPSYFQIQKHEMQNMKSNKKQRYKI